MKRVSLSIFLSFLAALIISCAHGQETEKKSPLNYLSGEHYQETANVMGVPVPERKPVNTKISGQVLLMENSLPVPLRFQLLILKRQNQDVMNVTTAADGTFEFSGVIPNGPYEIALISQKFQGSTKLDVTTYEIKNILLRVTPMDK